VLSINLLTGIGLLAGIAVPFAGLDYKLWTGLAGLLLWSYYFLLRVVVARAEQAART
jgi:hypothetical protein